MMGDKGGQHVVAPGFGPIARLKQENRDLKLEVKQLKKDHDECYEELIAAQQHVELNVAEVERLKKEVFDYRDGFMEAGAHVERLKVEMAALREILGVRWSGRPER